MENISAGVHVVYKQTSINQIGSVFMSRQKYIRECLIMAAIIAVTAIVVWITKSPRP
jgi:hypothetical protein